MPWQPLANVPLSRAAILALAEALPADAEPALRQALTARSARRFTNIWLASLVREDPWDAGLWLASGAALLPDAALLAGVAGSLSGDVPQALLDAYRTHKLGWDLGAVALLLSAILARRSHQPDPDGLWRLARKLARQQPGGLAEQALLGLAQLGDDPGLEDALGDLPATTLLTDLGALLDLPLRAVIPQQASAPPLARSAQKVGRNDPCPCGSDKKYKHCHEAEDQTRRADPSSVQGVTGAELEHDPHLGLSLDRLFGLRPHALAKLQVQRMQAPWVPLFLDRLLFFREKHALHRAYATLDDARWDELLEEHIAAATWDGDLALAGDLVAHHHGTPTLPPWVLGALVSTPQEHIDLAEELARDDLDGTPVAAALTLLHSPWPALGVLVSRAILPFLTTEEADPLLTELLDVRDQLCMAPWDPVDDVLYHLRHGHNAEVDQANQQLRQSLSEQQSALREAHWRLQQLQQAPKPEQQAPSSAESSPDPTLLHKIRALKSELKARHAERNALRRALKERQATPTDTEQPPAPESPSDAELTPKSEGRLRVPEFLPRFRDALVQVPQSVGRAAVEKAAQIAAGRTGAFVNTRALRGQHGLWRAKIGRSYRMLFRLGDHTVEVLDLVHRQDLDTRIRQLSGA